MPYASIADLPLRVRSHIPTHAQHIFRAVFNSVMEATGDEERAFKSAWSKVHANYDSPGDEMWHKDKPFKYEQKEKSEMTDRGEDVFEDDEEYDDLSLPDGDEEDEIEKSEDEEYDDYAISAGDVVVDIHNDAMLVKSIDVGGTVTFERNGREIARANYDAAMRMLAGPDMTVRREGDVIMKSGRVMRPGSRGGHPWRDAHGKWRYDVQKEKDVVPLKAAIDRLTAALTAKYGSAMTEWPASSKRVQRLGELRQHLVAAQKHGDVAIHHRTSGQQTRRRKESGQKFQESLPAPKVAPAPEQYKKEMQAEGNATLRAKALQDQDKYMQMANTPKKG